MSLPVFDANAAEEHFAALCDHYKELKEKAFRAANEGRSASGLVHSAETQKYLGMELAMREVLNYFSQYELPHAPEKSENAPLDIDELPGLHGQPVFYTVQFPDGSVSGAWAILTYAAETIFLHGANGITLEYTPGGKVGSAKFKNIYRYAADV